jgi:hypothetical protein
MIRFQPCPDSGPFKTSMAVHGLLESGFQRSEQFIALFWRQLLSYLDGTLLSFVCRHFVFNLPRSPRQAPRACPRNSN